MTRVVALSRLTVPALVELGIVRAVGLGHTPRGPYVDRWAAAGVDRHAEAAALRADVLTLAALRGAQVRARGRRRLALALKAEAGARAIVWIGAMRRLVRVRALELEPTSVRLSLGATLPAGAEGASERLRIVIPELPGVVDALARTDAERTLVAEAAARSADVDTAIAAFVAASEALVAANGRVDGAVAAVVARLRRLDRAAALARKRTGAWPVGV